MAQIDKQKLKDALNSFSNSSLFTATKNLLKELNVEIVGTNIEQRIEVKNFAMHFKSKSQSLEDALSCVDGVYFLGFVNNSALTYDSSGENFDKAVELVQKEGKYDKMFIFACNIEQEANITRDFVSALTRAFNKVSKCPVILVLRKGTTITLSTCERMDYVLENFRNKGERMGKVSMLRDIDCLNPHRGHLDILASLAGKSCSTFDELYNHWMEVFSNELLTKKFYGELYNWYEWAVGIVKFPNDLRTDKDDAKYNQEACIRLITRLIFVWFLKEKRLIPKEFFKQEYIRENLIDDFDPKKLRNQRYNADESKYYRLILQNLFFAMLNRPIVAEGKSTTNNRRFCGNAETNLLHYKSEFADGGADKIIKLANKTVPFLNGGLFDCLDKGNIYYDGFSERKESLEQLYVPDYLFFKNEETETDDLSARNGKKKIKNISRCGLIDIFNRYSFTIEENTPYDQDVSLDPELLGKVFENLLATYNPETQKPARKQTGSYYTPRDIVQYMVNESLVAHLKRIVGEGLEPEYRKLVSYADDEIGLTDEQKLQVMEAIYHCKVLDPACGSGAFPMGMLQQMVHILSKLDPTNEQWKEMMRNNAISATSAAYRTATDDERKEMLADIERSFDEGVNRPDYARKLYLIENCIYGVDIQPIAIQISKLRFFISLVVDQKPTIDAKSNFGIRPLPNLEAKFVAANSLVPLDRSKNLFTSVDVIREFDEQLKALNHRIFIAKKSREKEELKQLMFSIRCGMAQAMQNCGFIGDKGYQQLMAWEPFDQNVSAGFFDSEWMFGIQEGFDVVIANPPYLKERDNRTYFEPVMSTLWGQKYHLGKMDFWYYFMHKSIEIVKDNAVICFITSRYWIKSSGAKNVIGHIYNDATILSIVDFGKLKVFDAVVGLHMISLIQKGCNSDDCMYYKINDDVSNINSRLFSEVRVIKKEEIISDNYEINIEESKLETLSVKTIPLGEKYEVSQGVVEAPAKVTKKSYAVHPSPQLNVGDGVFVVTDAEVAQLSFTEFEQENCLVKYLTDGSVTKYRINTAAAQNLIYSDKHYKELISNNGKYNNIKKHLDNCREHITSSNAPYGLHRPRKKNAFLINKLIGPSMFKTPMFAYDDKGYFVGMSYNIVNQRYKEYSLFFLLGILNSSYANCWFCQNAKHRGVGVDVGVHKLKEFPIPVEPSVKIVEKIEQSVLNIIHTNSDQIHCESIDNLVYHLYNLTYDEILIVDPNTPITREEYDSFEFDN